MALSYKNAQEILRAGIRGSDLVKQILAFSRQSEHKMIPIRVQPVLKEVMKLMRSTIPSYIEKTNISNRTVGCLWLIRHKFTKSP